MSAPAAESEDEEELDDDEYEDEEYEEDVEDEVAATAVPAPHFAVKRAPQPKPKSEREVVMEQLNEAALADTSNDYELPKLSILASDKVVPFEQQQQEALKQAKILERT